MEFFSQIAHWANENEGLLQALAMVGGAAFVGISLLHTRRTQRRDGDAASNGVHEACDSGVATLAVVPFRGLGPSDESAHLAAGLGADLQVALQSLKSVRVVPHLAAAAYRSGDATPREIGDALGARYILTGTLRQVDDRLRVTAELADCRQSVVLWATQLDRKVEELFAVQQEIAREVTAATGLELTMAELGRLRRRPTEDLAAFELVLRALGLFIYERDPTSQRTMIDLARSAVERDPRYAYAHAVLAQFLQQSVWDATSPTPEADREEALHAASRALELAPNDPAVLASAGWSLAWEGVEGSRALRRALEIGPHDQLTRLLLSILLAARGELVAARDVASLLVLPAGPLRAFQWYMESLVASRTGDYERARELAERSIDEEPNVQWSYLVLANALGELGDPEAAERAARRALDVVPHFTAEHFASVWASWVDDPDFVIRGLRTAGLVSAA